VELEELVANKERELAVKDSRISELEQIIADRDNQIVTLKQSVTDLDNRLSQAVSAYRALVVKSNPGVPEELITGGSIEAIDKSGEDARVLIDKVRKELDAEIAGVRVPAGAPQRRTIDLSALSPQEKIKYAIGERR
jgi:uncharacterized coiled-coil protein SlyX